MSLVNDIARKMRTSMNTLNGLVTIARESIARGGDAPETLSEVGKSLDIVAEEVDRMVELVKDFASLDAPGTKEAAKPVRLASGRFSGRSILLVDDAPGNVLVISEMLSLCGAAVTTATDGQGAVDAFRKSDVGEFDCVLMDLRMPRMDGFEAAAAIRASDRADAKRVPVIAMSADIFEEDRRKAAEAGVNACVTKPIRFAELAEVLEGHFI